MTHHIRLRRNGPGEYVYGRLLISQAGDGSWYVFDQTVEGGDSIYVAARLGDVRPELDRLRQESIRVGADRP